VCFLYNFITSKLVLHVAEMTLLDKTILHSKPPATFRQIDGRVLLHPDDKFPYRRLLSWHAYWTLKKAGKLPGYKQFHQLSMKSSGGYAFPSDIQDDPAVSMMEAGMVASDNEDDSDGSGGSSDKQKLESDK
jgi:hypothetical protein